MTNHPSELETILKMIVLQLFYSGGGKPIAPDVPAQDSLA